MARLVLEKENGETIILREDVSEETVGSDILICSDYFATVLWSKDDIASSLIKMGFKDTDNNIEQVIASGQLEPLSICSDADWYVINRAIEKLKEQLERL